MEKSKASIRFANVHQILEEIGKLNGKFDYTEYFFIGFMYAQGYTHPGEIIELVNHTKSWSNKMELNQKQRCMYYLDTFAKGGNILENLNKEIKPDKLNKRDRKDFEKFDEASPEFIRNNLKNDFGTPKGQDQEIHVLENVKKPLHEECKEAQEKRVRFQDSYEESEKAIKDETVGECKICLSEINISELFGLDACSHVYHNDCMSMHLKTSIDMNKIPLECPIIECK